MFSRILRWLSIGCTAITLSALAAHVLELPNKFSLNGPLWLAVQQNLYRGWGPIIGPFEVVAIVSTWVRYLRCKHRTDFAPLLLAASLLTAALAVFFILNAPVNTAFAKWTATTLPPDWTRYRLRWEVGHAISFVLVLVAFVALLHNSCKELHHEPKCQ